MRRHRPGTGLDVEKLRLDYRKAWHPQRFPIPDWAAKGPHTFLGALKRIGFKLSLWLCCDYDLGVYEEECLAGRKPAAATTAHATATAGNVNVQEGLNAHLHQAVGRQKQSHGKGRRGPELGTLVRSPGLLRRSGRFGLQARRLRQVIEHPGRKWGNGMTDEEMHNLYPVIYAKQMAQGFENHTHRAMVFAGGYTGVQQFVASWAGDTGGGPQPLASM